MIITKGIGFAPAINLINLCWDKCPVDMIIDSEIKKMLPSGVHFMSSNNTSLCCGEGICGACSFGDQYGKVYKACKCY